MKKILFALVIFVVLLITFTGCMSTRHLRYENLVEGNHSNHGGGNYSNSGGGSRSGGCH